MSNVLKPAPNFTDSLRCKVESGSVNRLKKISGHLSLLSLPWELR